MASIYESSTYDEFDDGYIITDALEDIQDGKYVHPDINERDAILKICDCIKQNQN